MKIGCFNVKGAVDMENNMIFELFIYLKGKCTIMMI